MARTAIHPGEHLADELKALGMSAAALSRDINVPVNRITGIINGTRAITADTAVKVGRNAPCPCGSEKKLKKCCGSTLDR